MRKRSVFVTLLLAVVLVLVPLAAFAFGTISGTVTDATTSNPISGMPIQLLDSGGTQLQQVTTDASGLYSLASVTAGSGYQVKTGGGVSYTTQIVSNVTVTDGNTVTIDFSMLPGGKITGTVSDSSTTMPVAGIQVLVFDSNWNQYRTLVTDANGVYNAGGLPVRNDYRIAAVGNATYGGQWQYPFAVTPGTPLTVNFSLSAGGSASGTVTDSVSGLPVAGITVNPYCQTVFPGWPCGNPAVTDANGLYMIVGLNPLVTYTIQTGANASYQSAGQGGVSITAGNTTTVNLAIQPTAAGSGAISGTVTASGTGTPISGLQVNICDSTQNCSYGGSSTDASGNYTVTNLPPRTDYQVQVQGNASYATQTQSGISVTTGNTTTVNFALAAAGAVSGTITASNTGLPVSGIQVNASDGNWNWYGSAVTDASGNYTITGLPARTDYHIQVMGSGTYAGQTLSNISVTAGNTTTENFVLVLAGTISGTVTAADTSLPIANLNVSVNDSNGQWYGSAMTDPSGNYSIYGLPPRTDYQLFVEGNATYAGQMKTGISVVAGNVTAENFVLGLGGSISGTVRDAVMGLGISGMSVMAFDSTGGTWMQLGYTTTNPDGTYQLIGIAQGSHKVTAMMNNPGGWYIQQYYNGVAAQDLATGVTVTAGSDTAGIDFSMTKGGGISGTVRDGNGNPIANASVAAVTTGGNDIAWATADATGAYTLQPVPSGVRVRANFPGTDYVGQFYGGTMYPEQALTVPVTAETITTGADITLQHGTVLTGTVTVDGTPSSNNWVSLYSQTDSRWMFDSALEPYMLDSANGVWAIAVPAGTYKVWGDATIASGDLPSMYYDSTYLFDSASAVTTSGTGTVSGVNFAFSSLYGGITGTVSYAGAQTGTVIEWASPNPGNDWPNVSTVNGGSLGGYQLHSSAGAWYVKAFMDVNGNRSYDPGEPYGEYQGGSVVVTNGSTVSGVDITLTDSGVVVPPGILWRNATSGDLLLWNMNGVNMTGYAYLNPRNTDDPNWKAILTGDFNGDGKTDLLLQNTASGDLLVWYLNGSNMTGYAYLNPRNTEDPNWQVIATGDFNGDGKTDLLLQNIVSGDLLVWYLDGVNMTGYAYLNPKNTDDPNWKVIATGDFNGDGKTDLLLQNTASGDLLVWYLNGVNMTGYAYLNPKNTDDPNWKVVLTGDFNGDGKTDLLLQNAASGDLLVWYLNGVNMTGYAYLNPKNTDDQSWTLIR